MLDSHLILGTINQCLESKSFARWVKAVYKWAENRGVDVEPAFNTEWCAKIVLHDSKGRFFDFIYPRNSKKSESDDAYETRIAKELDEECAQLRKLRIQMNTGREPAAKAA